MKQYLIHLRHNVLFSFIAFTLFSTNVLSQGAGSFGNTFIFGNTEMAIYGTHNFQVGATGVLPGIVGTERTDPQGVLSFTGAASWTGASNAAHVDGYVKTYLNTPFIFPIGDNGVYAPVAVSTASVGGPATAAYYKTDPSTAITTSLKGGNETILPAGAPFNIANKDAELTKVSSMEYWDINGATAAKISLTWNTHSNIAALTNNQLTTLTIAGWDGTKWVAIPSTIDATSILSGSSTLLSGSITTDNEITPNIYNVYTLAKGCTPIDNSYLLTATSPCPGGTAIIKMSGSQIGVSYQLQKADGTNIGLAVMGTGDEIYFSTPALTFPVSEPIPPYPPPAGFKITPTIINSNLVCGTPIPIVIDIPIPIQRFNVIRSDASSFCKNDGTIHIQSAGNQANALNGQPEWYVYRLYKDNVLIETTDLRALDAPMTFKNLAEGKYYITITEGNGCEHYQYVIN